MFKGGTALRKLFAGAAGRFSTDIDLALRDADSDSGPVTDLVAEHCTADLGPFTFAASQRRGRWMIEVDSDFGTIPIPLKLDVGPPCWLEPELRSFVPAPVHRVYDFELPVLPTVALVENVAEKIARLNRFAAARDASDLVWAARTPPHSAIDRTLVRRLAVLKVWVDVNGLDGHWTPADSARPFDAAWLQSGREWDDESIGLLAHPAPSIADLERDLIACWSDIAALDTDDLTVAEADPRDRAKVIDLITELPQVLVTREDLWRR